MAKRQRGGSRPGQRAPLQRGSHPAGKAAVRPVPVPAPRPSGGLSDDELARAAELEARIVEEERAASASLSRGRDRRRGGDATPAARSRSTTALAVVAEDEYRYVTRDLRRIAIVFTGVFGILVASWLLAGAAGVIGT